LIKRVALSDKDRSTLKRLLDSRPPAGDGEPPRDYRGRVVLKPWGHEYLIFQNDYVAVWALHIKHGHSTSMHCHPLKKTCLILLSGDALCNTFYRRNYLSGMAAVIIEQGVFHSTHALSENGIHLLEIETPPNKTDLVRLNDAYGREASGYETESAMETERLERFNYFYVDESTPCGDVSDRGDCTIAVQSFADDAEFQSAFQPLDEAYYAPCRGSIIDAEGRPLVDVGETLSGTSLRALAKSGMRASGPLFLLVTRDGSR
jgi:mannose-6-phosphate isomerase-like protein (cupin superfamily)